MGRFDARREDQSEFAANTSLSDVEISRTDGETENDGLDRRGYENSGPGDAARSQSHAEIIAAIEASVAGKPTLSEFIERLELRGVQAVPSVQRSGRLNGISYRFGGQTIQGSRLGRAYTAQGLQQRKGVQYAPERDDVAVRIAVERAGVRLPDRSEVSELSNRERRTRDADTGLSPDQMGTLTDIGRFRTVNVEDLIQHRYAGNAAQFDRDMRVLIEAGMAERRSIHHAKSRAAYTVAVLTHRGRSLLRSEEKRRGDESRPQTFYAGFVKPGEVRHDIGIYRMYQAEAARIERAGGSIRRVTLDFELKKRLFSELNREKERSDSDYESRKAEIAERNGLHVHHGRVVIPDLRIEFETRDHEMNKVDLELATDDYKHSQVRAKHAAGLKIYAPDTAAGSPALQQDGLIAELISL